MVDHTFVKPFKRKQLVLMIIFSSLDAKSVLKFFGSIAWRKSYLDFELLDLCKHEHKISRHLHTNAACLFVCSAKNVI